MSDDFKDIVIDVISILSGDATLTGLVGSRIYTDVPDNETFPYINVSVTSGDYSVKDQVAMEHNIQVSAYSRDTSLDECSDIRSRVYDLLNRQEVAFTTSSVSNIMFNGFANVAKEPDGKTWQSVIQFDAVML